MPEDVWSESRKEVGFTPASVCPPLPCASSSVAFSLNDQVLAQALSSSYASWVRSVEISLHRHHGIEDMSSISRCSGAQFKETEVHDSQKHRTNAVRDVIAAWWCRLHTLLFSLGRHQVRENGRRQRQYLLEAIKQLVAECPEQAHTGLKVTARGDPSWRKWQIFQTHLFSIQGGH